MMRKLRFNNPKWSLCEPSESKWFLDKNTSGVGEQIFMFVSLQK